MKQYITSQQFEELSPDQQANLMKRWTKSVGDLIYCKSELDDVYFGVITEVKGGKAYSAWDMGGTTAPAMRIINGRWYPLFCYGQLVEILIDLYGHSVDLNYKTIDDLWRLVREKL